MKKAAVASFVILSAALIVLCVNWLVTPLSDWVIRGSGIASLVALFVFVFSTVKMRLKNS